MPLILPTPRSMTLHLSTRCNLRCRYCSYFTSSSEVTSEISTEEWLNFFKELKLCSVVYVKLQGAEPLCRPDIKELIRGIVENRMRFQLFTNGTLITDELAEFFASTRRCDLVRVSVDGSCSAVHDATRGKGSFTKVMSGIELLRKHNLPAGVNVTLNRHNAHDLENVVRFLLKDMKFDTVSIGSAIHHGLCKQNAQELELTIQERSKAMRVLVNLLEYYPGRLKSPSGALFEAQKWSKMKQEKEQGNATSKKGRLSACGTVMRSLSVRADGMMIPCTLLSHIELGRINQNSLRDVWKNHPELTRLRTQTQISLREFIFCKGCEYIDHCTGGCPGDAFDLTGSDCHPSPAFCLKRFLESGGELPVSRQSYNVPEQRYSLSLTEEHQWDYLNFSPLAKERFKVFTETTGIRPYSGKNSSKIIIIEREIFGLKPEDVLASLPPESLSGLPIKGWKFYPCFPDGLLLHPEREDILLCFSSNNKSNQEKTYRREFFFFANLLFPVYRRAFRQGGMPLHAAMVELDGDGYLIVSLAGTGKTTCCQRIPKPWTAHTDEEALIIRKPDGDYAVHPFPNLCNFQVEQDRRNFEVERGLPLKGIFFLEQGRRDCIKPINKIEAFLRLKRSSGDIFQRYYPFMGNVPQHRRTNFWNSWKILERVPCFSLSATLHGKFWEAMEGAIRAIS